MSGPPLSEFVTVNMSLADSAEPDVFSFGTPLGVFTTADTSERVFGPFTSPEEVNDALPAATEPEANAWANAALSQAKRPESIYVGRADAADATLTATLDAIEAEIGADSFYLLNIEDRTKAEILLAAAWAEARGGDAPKLFIAQTAEADVLAGTAGNTMLSLQTLNYERTACIYHRHSDSTDGDVATDGYLDGAWTGRCGAFNLDGPNGRGAWYQRRLSGVTGDPMSSAQSTAIYDAGGNLYGTTKGLSMTSRGKTAAGKFIDIRTSLDWGRIRIGEAVIALMASEERDVIPFDGSGINLVASAAQGVLEQGVTFGHFSRDHARKIVKPKIQDVAIADKVARAITMQGQVTLAGGIYSATFNITVFQ